LVCLPAHQKYVVLNAYVYAFRTVAVPSD
jgi:hypothetical protein